MLYEMETQLATGKVGEDAIVRTFSPMFEIEESTRNEQRQGIDFWFTHRTTSARTSVEVKTDWVAEKTGNAFIETVSRSEGWTRSFSERMDLHPVRQTA